MNRGQRLRIIQQHCWDIWTGYVNESFEMTAWFNSKGGRMTVFVKRPNLQRLRREMLQILREEVEYSKSVYRRDGVVPSNVLDLTDFKTGRKPTLQDYLIAIEVFDFLMSRGGQNVMSAITSFHVESLAFRSKRSKEQGYPHLSFMEEEFRKFAIQFLEAHSDVNPSFAAKEIEAILFSIPWADELEKLQAQALTGGSNG